MHYVGQGQGQSRSDIVHSDFPIDATNVGLCWSRVNLNEQLEVMCAQPRFTSDAGVNVCRTE